MAHSWRTGTQQPATRRTQRATFVRLTNARKLSQATEAAIREGRHFKTTEAKRHTLADLIERCVKDVLPCPLHKSKRHRSTRNQQIIKAQLAWWMDELGALLTADEWQDIQEVIAEHAAIREHLGGESAADAQHEARAAMRVYLYRLQNNPKTSHTLVCPGCNQDQTRTAIGTQAGRGASLSLFPNQ